MKTWKNIVWVGLYGSWTCHINKNLVAKYGEPVIDTGVRELISSKKNIFFFFRHEKN